ncbi:hypothetical protein [Clostridium sp. BJN0013]|uniref:hypothetical protein n=1 Tax=Clostridium sp. BJN0013 TaxID=3236840 RepID=UPI0034C5FEF8
MIKHSKKTISLILGAAILVSSTITLSTTTVKAQSIPQTQSTSVTKITDISEAIKLIEQQFLIKNSDGTTTINVQASKYIDSNILEQIEKGSEQINSSIKNGTLIYDKKSNTLKSNILIKNSSTIQTMSTTVDGTYVWHWYGFDFVMNGTNSGIFSAKLAQYSAVLAAGGVVGSVIPGVAFVCGASSATMAYWSAVAAEGAASGRGSIAYYLGDPSWAQLTHVDAR